MPAVAEPIEKKVKQARCAPTPACFFLTPKVIDEVPALNESPLAERVREILLATETDLFRPLLCSARPNEFAQEFAILANRYFPVRLQTLVMILNEVGLERFRSQYFERIPNVAVSFAMNAGHWGLPVDDVVDSFRQYFDCAVKIIKVFPHVANAPVAHLLRLANSVAEIDYGFTAMGLVFEGNIQAVDWRLSELFRLTRRSLLEYENATDGLIAYLSRANPEQTLMFKTERSLDKKVMSIHPRALGEPGKHLRSVAKAVDLSSDDPDSDYE